MVVGAMPCNDARWRCVDTLVDSLSATQRRQRGQSTLHPVSSMWVRTCNRQLSCWRALFFERSCPSGLASPTHRGECQPCLHNLPCLGSASPCRRRWPVGSSLYSLKHTLRFVLVSCGRLRGHALRLCSLGQILGQLPNSMPGTHDHNAPRLRAALFSPGPQYGFRPGDQ